jgi:hypothetical protein
MSSPVMTAHERRAEIVRHANSIGIDEAYISRGVDAEVADALQSALRTLAALGAMPVPVTMPQVNAVVSDWAAHCGVEAAVANSATFPARRSEYGPVLAALLDGGLGLSGTDYQRILLARAELTGRMHALMQGVDLLLTPVIPFAVPSLAQLVELRTQPCYRLELMQYTAPFNMSGHPTITLPAGFTREPSVRRAARWRIPARGTARARRACLPECDGLACAAAARRLSGPDPLQTRIQTFADTEPPLHRNIRLIRSRAVRRVGGEQLQFVRQAEVPPGRHVVPPMGPSRAGWRGDLPGGPRLRDDASLGVTAAEPHRLLFAMLEEAIGILGFVLDRRLQRSDPGLRRARAMISRRRKLLQPLC